CCPWGPGAASGCSARGSRSHRSPTRPHRPRAELRSGHRPTPKPADWAHAGGGGTEALGTWKSIGSEHSSGSGQGEIRHEAGDLLRDLGGHGAVVDRGGAVACLRSVVAESEVAIGAELV